MTTKEAPSASLLIKVSKTEMLFDEDVKAEGFFFGSPKTFVVSLSENNGLFSTSRKSAFLGFAGGPSYTEKARKKRRREDAIDRSFDTPADPILGPLLSNLKDSEFRWTMARTTPQFSGLESPGREIVDVGKSWLSISNARKNLNATYDLQVAVRFAGTASARWATVARYSVYSTFAVDLPITVDRLDRGFAGTHLSREDARRNFERAFSFTGEDKFFTDPRWCVHLLERFTAGIKKDRNVSTNAMLGYLVKEFADKTAGENFGTVVTLTASEFIPVYAGVKLHREPMPKILKTEYRRIFAGYDLDRRVIESVSEDYALGFETFKRDRYPFGKIVKAARAACEILFSGPRNAIPEIENERVGWNLSKRGENFDALAVLTLKFLYFFLRSMRGEGWSETLGDALFKEAVDEHCEIGPLELLGGTRRRRTNAIAGILESVSTSESERSDFLERFEFLEDIPPGYYDAFSKGSGAIEKEKDDDSFRRDDFRTHVLKISRWEGGESIKNAADVSLFNWILYVDPWTGAWNVNYTDRFSPIVPIEKRETVVVDRLPFFYTTDEENDSVKRGTGKLQWTTFGTAGKKGGDDDVDTDYGTSYDARNFISENTLRIDAGFDFGSGERTYALWSVSDLIFSVESGSSANTIDETAGAFYSRKLVKIVKFILPFDPFVLERTYEETQSNVPEIRIGLENHETWVKRSPKGERSSRKKTEPFTAKLSRDFGEILIKPSGPAHGTITVDAYALSTWKDVRSRVVSTIDFIPGLPIPADALVDDEKGDIVEEINYADPSVSDAIQKVAGSAFSDMKVLIGLSDIMTSDAYSLFENDDDYTLDPKSVDAMRKILESAPGSTLIDNPGRCAEIVCEAIAKSKNVSDMVRLEAYRISLLLKIARAAVERDDRDSDAKNALTFLILEARLIFRITATYTADIGSSKVEAYEDVDFSGRRWLRSDAETIRRFLSSILKRESPHLAVTFSVAKKKIKKIVDSDPNAKVKGWEFLFLRRHSDEIVSILSTFVDEHMEGWKNLWSSNLSETLATSFPKNLASPDDKRNAPPPPFLSEEEEDESLQSLFEDIVSVKVEEDEDRIDVSPSVHFENEDVSQIKGALQKRESLSQDQARLVETSFEPSEEASLLTFVKKAYATPKIRDSFLLPFYLETVDESEISGDKLENLVNVNEIVNLSLVDVSEIDVNAAGSQTPTINVFMTADFKGDVRTNPGFCRFLSKKSVDSEDEGTLSKWAYYAVFCTCAAMFNAHLVDSRSEALAKIYDFSVFDGFVQKMETSFEFAIAGMEGADPNAAKTVEEKEDYDANVTFLYEKSQETHRFLKTIHEILKAPLSFSDPGSERAFSSQQRSPTKKKKANGGKKKKIASWTDFFRNEIARLYRNVETVPTVEGSLLSACLTVLFGASACAICLRATSKCEGVFEKASENSFSLEKISDAERKFIAKGSEPIPRWGDLRLEFHALYARQRGEYERISAELARYVYEELTNRLGNVDVLLSRMSPEEINRIKEEGETHKDDRTPQDFKKDDAVAKGVWKRFSKLEPDEFEMVIDRDLGMSRAFQEVWAGLHDWLQIKRSWHETNLMHVLYEPLEAHRRAIEREEQERKEEEKRRKEESPHEGSQISREEKERAKNILRDIRNLSDRFADSLRNQKRAKANIDQELKTTRKTVEETKRAFETARASPSDDTLEMLAKFKEAIKDTDINIRKALDYFGPFENELSDRLTDAKNDPLMVDLETLENKVERFEDLAKETVSIMTDLQETLKAVYEGTRALSRRMESNPILPPLVKPEPAGFEIHSTPWKKIVERLKKIELDGSSIVDFDFSPMRPRDKVAGSVPGFYNDDGKRTLAVVTAFLSYHGADYLTEDFQKRIVDAIKKSIVEATETGYEFTDDQRKNIKEVGKDVITDLEIATTVVYPILSVPGLEGQRAEFVFSVCTVYLEAIVFELADNIDPYHENSRENLAVTFLEFIRLFSVALAPITNEYFLLQLWWTFFETFSKTFTTRGSWKTMNDLKPILVKVVPVLKTYAYFSFLVSKGIRFYYDAKTDDEDIPDHKTYRYDHYGLLAVASRFSDKINLGDIGDSFELLKKEIDDRLKRIKNLNEKFTPATDDKIDEYHNYIQFDLHQSAADRIYPAFWWFIETFDFNLSLTRAFEIEIKSNIFPPYDVTEEEEEPKNVETPESMAISEETMDTLYDDTDVEKGLYTENFYRNVIKKSTIPRFLEVLRFLSTEDKSGAITDPKDFFDLIPGGDLEKIYEEMYYRFLKAADPEKDSTNDLQFVISMEAKKDDTRSVKLTSHKLSTWVALRSARLTMALYSFMEIKGGSGRSSRTEDVYLRIRNSRALLVNSLVYYDSPDYSMTMEEPATDKKGYTLAVNVSPRFVISVGPSDDETLSKARKSFWEILLPNRSSIYQPSPKKDVQSFMTVGPKIPSPYASVVRDRRTERSEAESRVRDSEKSLEVSASSPDPFYFWMSLKVLGDINPDWLFGGRTADDVLPSSRTTTINWKARFLREDVATGKLYDPQENKWGVVVDEIPSTPETRSPLKRVKEEDARAKKIRESCEVRAIMRAQENSNRPLYLVLLEAVHREERTGRKKNDTLCEFLSKMKEVKIHLESIPSLKNSKDDETSFLKEFENDADTCNFILTAYGRFAKISPFLSVSDASYVNRFTGVEENRFALDVSSFCTAYCGEKNVAKLKTEMSMDPLHRPFELPATLRRLLDRHVVYRMLFWCKAVVEYGDDRKKASKSASLDRLSSTSEDAISAMTFYDVSKAAGWISTQTQNGYEFTFSFVFPEDVGAFSQPLASWFYEETIKRFSGSKHPVRIDFDEKNTKKMFVSVIDEDSILYESTKKSRFLLKATYRQIYYAPKLEKMIGVDMLGNRNGDPEADLLFIKDKIPKGGIENAYPKGKPRLPIPLSYASTVGATDGRDVKKTFIGKFDNVEDRFEHPSVFDPFDGLEDTVIRFFAEPGIPTEAEFKSKIFDVSKMIKDADLIVITTEG